jgi:hypothetical protein
LNQTIAFETSLVYEAENRTTTIKYKAAHHKYDLRTAIHQSQSAAEENPIHPNVNKKPVEPKAPAAGQKHPFDGRIEVQPSMRRVVVHLRQSLCGAFETAGPEGTISNLI